MARPSDVVEYSITRYSESGDQSERIVTRDNGHFIARTRGDETDPGLLLGPIEDGIARAVMSDPGLVTMQGDVTKIQCRSKGLLRQLPGLLRVSDLAALTRHAAMSETVGNVLDEDDIEFFEEGDGYLTQVASGGSARIVPTWIRVNDLRAFLLVDSDRAAFGLLDQETGSPVITRSLLEWGFYSESGGPVSWDGYADLGECGPSLWCLNQRGDLDPGSRVFFAPADENTAEQVARLVAEAEWELPFALAVVGTPGLTEAEVDALTTRSDVEGPWVVSHLTRDVAKEALSLLAESHSVRRAVEALGDPESPAGIATYGWLRQMAFGAYQSASWNDVHSAMIGEVGPPPVDLAPQSMEQRWADTVRSGEIAVAVSLGYALPIEIPDGLEREFVLLELTTDLPVDYEPLIASLVAQASTEALEKAVAILGTDPDPTVTVAWRAYERCTSDQPDREREFWDAYETIIRRDSRLALAEEYRAKASEAEKQEAFLQALDWPVQWPVKYASLWIRLGGTDESARAWAAAGWSVREVLLEEQLRLPWNAPVEERVRTLDVPSKPKARETS